MTVDDLKEYYQYLDFLRKSKVVNMWGASSYLVDEFHLSGTVSRKVLTSWMATFDEKTSLHDRAVEGLKEYQ